MYTDHGCQDSGRPHSTLFMYTDVVTDHGCQDSGRPIVLCLCILITDVRIVVDP